MHSDLVNCLILETAIVLTSVLSSCCESLWKQLEGFFGGHLVSVIGRPVVEKAIVDARGGLRQLRAAVHLVGAYVAPAFA